MAKRRRQTKVSAGAIPEVSAVSAAGAARSSGPQQTFKDMGGKGLADLNG